MRKRTLSEIKAYGDGYVEAYKQFCHLLKRHEKETAIRKMKIFADAVALTVETSTGEPCTADTPQTEDLQDWKDRMWAEAVIEPQTITIEGRMSLEDWRKICPEHPQFKDEPQTDCETYRYGMD